MKKIFLLTLTTAFFLLPGSALALSLQETQQFRALDSYVVALSERSDSAASPEEKITYRERLALKRDNALERLVNLREKRVLQAKKVHKKKKSSLLSRLENGLRRGKEEARNNYRENLGEAKSTYRKRLAELDKRYGSEVKSLKRKISALRKKLRKSKDPSKRVDIGNTINSLQGALKPLASALSEGQREAQKTYDRKAAKLQGRLKKDIAAKEREFTRDWKEGKAQLAGVLSSNLNGIRSTVSREREDVLALYREGSAIIDGMPSPSSKKKTKKAHQKGRGR